jgi:hypothetical protein
MALEYELRLATERAPADVLAVLSNELGFSGNTDQRTAPGLASISALNENRLGQDVIKSAFGFTPLVKILFRLNKDEIERGVMSVLRACMRVLDHVKGDAVLLFNGEAVILLRKSGNLILNENAEFWTHARVALVRPPYDNRKIPPL